MFNLTKLQVNLDIVTPMGDAAAISVETMLFAQKLHFDKKYGVIVGRQPLQLLSLGLSLFLVSCMFCAFFSLFFCGS